MILDFAAGNALDNDLSTVLDQFGRLSMIRWDSAASWRWFLQDFSDVADGLAPIRGLTPEARLRQRETEQAQVARWAARYMR